MENVGRVVKGCLTPGVEYQTHIRLLPYPNTVHINMGYSVRNLPRIKQLLLTNLTYKQMDRIRDDLHKALEAVLADVLCQKD